MTDFAGASLRIQPIGDDATMAALDRIDRRAQQSAEAFTTLYGRSVAESEAAFDRLYGKQGDAAEKASARAVAAAERAAAADETRVARSTQSVSRGLEIIARTGSVTGRSMDNILASVSNIALGFGPEGLFVGALAIGASAIVDIFRKADKELEKLQTQFNTRLEEMTKAGNVAGIGGRFGIATELQSGDALAAIVTPNSASKLDPTSRNFDLDFFAKARGIQGLTSERARRQALLDQAQTADQSTAPMSEAMRNSLDAAVRAQEASVQQVDKLLDDFTTRYKAAMALLPIATKEAVDKSVAAADKAGEKLTLRALTTFAPSVPNQTVDFLAASGSRRAFMNRFAPTLTGGAEQSDEQRLNNLKDVYIYERDVAQAAQDEQKYLAAITKIKGVLKDIADLRKGQDRIDVTSGEVEKASKTAAAEGEKSMSVTMRSSEIRMQEWARRVSETADRVSQEIGASIVTGINVGMQAAFTKGANVGSVFKAITGFVLEQFGEMFEQIGETALAGLTFMATIKNALTSFLPEVGIPAALGLIALGAVLKATGARMSGSLGAGGGGTTPLTLAPITGRTYVNSTPGSPPITRPTSIATRSIVQPVFNIIGTNDARAARQIQEMLDMHARRAA